MRIKQIEIYGFGKWQNVSFDCKRDIQIFIGNNEAGKSTLNAFILSVLFGFSNASGKNKYAQYLPKKGGAYGGCLVIEDENKQIIKIKRVSGKSGGEVSLIFPDGHIEGQSALDKLLKHVDRHLYESIYQFDGLSISNLKQFSQKELTQQLLTVGALDNQQWLVEAQSLRQKAAQLYKTSGRLPELNQKIIQYEVQQEHVNHLKQRLPLYQAKQKQLSELEAQIQMLLEQQKIAKEEYQKRQNELKLWPLYQSLLQLENTDSNAETTPNADEYQHYLNMKHKGEWLERQLDLLLPKTTEMLSIEQNDDGIEQAEKLKSETQRLLIFNEENEPKMARKQQVNSAISTLITRHKWEKQTPDLLTPQELEGLKNDIELTEEFDFNRRLTQAYQNDSQQESRQQRSRTKKTERKKALFFKQQFLFSGVVFVIWLVCLAIFSAAWLITLVSLVALIGLILIWSGGRLWPASRKENPVETIDSSSDEIKSDQETKMLKAELDADRKILLEKGYQPELSLNAWYDQQVDLQRLADLKQESKELTLWEQNFYSKWQMWHQNCMELGLSVSEDSPLDSEMKSVLQQLFEKINIQNRNEQTKHYQLSEKKELQTQLAVNQTEMEQMLGTFHFGSGSELEMAYELNHNQDAKDARINVYRQQLGENEMHLSHYVNCEALNNALNQAKITEDRLTDQLQQVEQKRTRLRIECHQWEQDGTLTQERQKMAAQKAAIQSDFMAWSSYLTTAEWIEKALQLASKDRQPALIIEAEKDLALLTQGKYVQIRLGNRQVELVSNSQEVFALQELSLGTRQQLFVALRFAFAKQLSGLIQLPLIIDEGFADFDDERRKVVLGLLEQMAPQLQVIYLTTNHAVYDVFKKDQIIELSKEE